MPLVIALLLRSKEKEKGDRAKDKEKKGRDNKVQARYQHGVAGMVDTKRLEHGPYSVAEMDRQCHKCCDIENGDGE